MVARAGMGTISELSALNKAAIVVPLPGSAQEKNAQALEERNVARICFQSQTRSLDLLHEIRLLMQNSEERNRLGAQIGSVLDTSIADIFINRITSFL